VDAGNTRIANNVQEFKIENEDDDEIGAVPGKGDPFALKAKKN
jgi:hypothetical protein